MLAAVGLLTYAAIGNPFDPFDNRSFSSKRWKSGSEDLRARMGRSAVDQAKPGMSEAQIEAAFGKPDEIDANEDAGGNKLPGMQTWEWRLGSWSTYGYDDAFFYVSLDQSGKVIAAQVNGY